MYAVAMSDAIAGPVAGADDASTLLTRIAEIRDKDALAALFRLYGPRIKSMMLKLGADNALAEDLTQETLLTVWRKAHLYTPERGAPSTWMFTIARNLRIDHIRRQSNQPYADIEGLEIASESDSSHMQAERRQVVERVSEALETLSPEQREVVHLSFVQDIAHAEIAERLGIPLGTVKSRLRLAYERLRPVLGDLR